MTGHRKGWAPPPIKSYMDLKWVIPVKCVHASTRGPVGDCGLLTECVWVLIKQLCSFCAVWCSRQLRLKSLFLFASGRNYWRVIMAGKLSSGSQHACVCLNLNFNAIVFIINTTFDPACVLTWLLVRGQLHWTVSLYPRKQLPTPASIHPTQAVFLPGLQWDPRPASHHVQEALLSMDLWVCLQ